MHRIKANINTQAGSKVKLTLKVSSVGGSEYGMEGFSRVSEQLQQRHDALRDLTWTLGTT